MARQIRIVYPGAAYHVTSRGNRREPTFFQDSDREKFLDILGRTKEKYRYIIHAYVLMENHYHLFLETPFPNLPEVMQNINTSYTVYINRKHRRSGHLFQGRYKAIIVDRDNYLLALSRYIHLNPVRAKAAARPEEYPWSSYGEFLRSGRKGLADVDLTLGYFSEDRQKAIRAYREFVQEGLEQNSGNPFQEVQGGLVLGSEDFVRKIREGIRELKEKREYPSARRIGAVYPAEMVLEKVVRDFQVAGDWLRKRSRGRKERGIAVFLLKVLSQLNNEEIGKIFGISGAAVSARIRAVSRELEENMDLKMKVEKIRNKIEALKF